ncbi:hypothetical protein Q3H58_004099 [Pseudomonas psychrotolerans]|nr:hypothetical protein [Pseudomonas psychrotolerans]
MNKPASLRAQLLASIPELHDNPNRLVLTVTQGRLHCTGATSLSWEYAYQLRLTLSDFAGDVDLVLLALLLWVRENQSDLLVSLDQGRPGHRLRDDHEWPYPTLAAHRKSRDPAPGGRLLPTEPPRRAALQPLPGCRYLAARHGRWCAQRMAVQRSWRCRGAGHATSEA